MTYKLEAAGLNIDRCCLLVFFFTHNSESLFEIPHLAELLLKGSHHPLGGSTGP